jgi:predicted DNA-binding transcriptional regulator YafY
MNRIDRLTAILIQLQTKQWVTAEEIARRYEISLRTVYRDMRALEEAGVPIGAETGKGYFIVEGYHLPPVMLTREEARALLIADKLVDKFTDSSVRRYYAAVTDKIKSILPDDARDSLEEMNSKVEVFFTGHSSDGEFPNNFLSPIQEALATGKCLRLDYHAGYSQKRSSGRVVDPLGLVFYGNAWHLIGHCKLRNEMRDFRLDRILQLRIVDEPAREKKKGDLKKYFKEFWLTTDLFEVRVWFHQSIAGAITGYKYYFGFIDEYPEGEGVIMSFAVSEYAYIAHWLFSFGERVRIIEPESLRDQMVELVRKLAEIYLKEK